MSDAELEVLATGPLVTVQDRGRPGHAHLGVPRSGALDAAAHIAAPIRRLDVQRRGILQIVAAHRFQQDRAVFNRLRDRTSLVE